MYNVDRRLKKGTYVINAAARDWARYTLIAGNSFFAGKMTQIIFSPTSALKIQYQVFYRKKKLLYTTQDSQKTCDVYYIFV